MYEIKVECTGFKARVENPSEVAFWIKNEIGNYNNIAVDTQKWCETANKGEIYTKSEENNVLLVVAKI